MMIQKSVCLDTFIPISNSTDLLRRLFRQHRPTTDIAVNSAAVGGVVRTRARVFRALRQAREPLSWVDVRNIRGPEVRMHAELAGDDRSGQSGSIERNEMLSSVSSVAVSQQQFPGRPESDQTRSDQSDLDESDFGRPDLGCHSANRVGAKWRREPAAALRQWERSKYHRVRIDPQCRRNLWPQAHAAAALKLHLAPQFCL